MNVCQALENLSVDPFRPDLISSSCSNCIRSSISEELVFDSRRNSDPTCQSNLGEFFVAARLIAILSAPGEANPLSHSGSELQTTGEEGDELHYACVNMSCAVESVCVCVCVSVVMFVMDGGQTGRCTAEKNSPPGTIKKSNYVLAII